MEDLASLWPLYAFRVRTEDLEMRFATESDLAELAVLALEDIHDPATMPFSVPWSDQPPRARARSVLQWNWRMRAEWDPAAWHLPLVAVQGGRVVGTQGMTASHFSTTRVVETGSWIGRRFQGAGIGTSMRRAVLHLAFSGLGAEIARSAAFTDNATSLKVSEKLGYLPDGTEDIERRGERATIQRLLLTRSRWEELSGAWPEVTIERLEPALWMFGVGDPPEDAGTAVASS